MDELKKQEAAWFIGKLCAFFLLGLVAGILFINVSYTHRSSEADVFGYYLVEQLKNNKLPSKDYMLYIVRYRGKFWITAILIGMSSYAKGCVIIFVVVSGFLAGSLSCTMLVQQGVKAMLFITLANLPQGICYIIAALLLFTVIGQREGKKIFKSKVLLKNYLTAACWSLCVFMVGVFSEAYLNPYVLDLLTKCLQI